MATDYGVDTQAITDLQLIDTLVTSPAQLIGQRIARRLQTARGGLAAIGDDPDFGWDVRQYINKALGPNEIAVAEAQIAAECEKDEEVYSASVAMSITGGVIKIDIAFTSAAGPFTLTLSVNDLTTALVFGF